MQVKYNNKTFLVPSESVCENDAHYMGTVCHNMKVISIYIENDIICTEVNFDFNIR